MSAESIRGREPCKAIGDLLIASSRTISTFYTFHGKESQHFCRALQQNLIVRPTNPERDDIVCATDPETWDRF